MTSKRQPLRGNAPAPYANVRMLPDRRPKKTKPQPVELEPVAEPAVEPPADMVAVKLSIVFTVDGQAAFNAEFQTAMPRLPADQDAMGIQVAMDGRKVVELLEPHVGPSSASVVAPKPGLWVPGES